MTVQFYFNQLCFYHSVSHNFRFDFNQQFGDVVSLSLKGRNFTVFMDMDGFAVIVSGWHQLSA